MPIAKLLAVMKSLRTPETGCPWDLAQDFRSIVPYTLEEAYEVADAIERADMKALREELGDLLLQSVYHAQMASEAGLFTFDDVVRDITEKMISRHPHVFGDQKAVTPEEVSAIWEEKKQAEKTINTTQNTSVLDHIPLAFPALLRALKLQKKAAKTGFEWTDISRVLEKLDEEILELKEALTEHSSDEILNEIGDVLFVAVNVARLQGIDPEMALRHTNAKFERRFRGLEKELQLGNEKNDPPSLTQMEQEWVRQKLKERPPQLSKNTA